MQHRSSAERVLVPILALVCLVGGGIVTWKVLSQPAPPSIMLRDMQRRGLTIEDRLSEFGDAARARLRATFELAGVPYPPERVVLVGIKDDRTLRIYASAGLDLKPVGEYPVLALSGGLGPKLIEGDRQVPEGIYRIESLNPNSRYHVSLRLDYPNSADRARAALDGRTNLGGDIMIHGGAVSVGCLAIGDEAAEELFTLAADVGPARIEVILTPVDFRSTRLPPESEPHTAWVEELYEEIRQALAALP